VTPEYYITLSTSFAKFKTNEKHIKIIPEANFSQVGRLSNAVDTTERNDVRLSSLLGGHDVTQDVDTPFRGEQSQQRVGQGVLDSAMDALENLGCKIRFEFEFVYEWSFFVRASTKVQIEETANYRQSLISLATGSRQR
jgi:hypothetical protein